MHTIWKVQVPIKDEFALELPEGAQFLSVQMQHGITQSWWLVDPESRKVRRMFRVHGTGHPVPCADAIRFLGTFQMRGGALVFHMFEETPNASR